MIPSPKKGPNWAIKEIGVYKCDTTRKTMVGILWTRNEQVFFEHVHGFTDSDSLEDIVITCRQSCVGTFVPGKIAKRMFDNFIKLRKASSARTVYERLKS